MDIFIAALQLTRIFHEYAYGGLRPLSIAECGTNQPTAGSLQQAEGIVSAAVYLENSIVKSEI